MSRQPPPFDHGQTDRRSDRRPRQTAASDSSDSVVNDEEIRIDRSSVDERISILHFEEFSKGFGEKFNPIFPKKLGKIGRREFEREIERESS